MFFSIVLTKVKKTYAFINHIKIEGFLIIQAYSSVVLYLKIVCKILLFGPMNYI